MVVLVAGVVISIHALREEGDAQVVLLIEAELRFLSTPSARRATFQTKGHSLQMAQFLSTPSARRATDSPVSAAILLTNFYPRPPRGGRRP